MRESIVDGIVLAGGRGSRLGGVSKADLEVSGRLLDRVVEALEPRVNGRILVVAPEGVGVPEGVLRTMEEPPGGGPLAAIGAGAEFLSRTHPTVPDDAERLVLVFSVDSPGAEALAPRLLDALASRPCSDGALIVGGDPPFRQYLQAVYRFAPLLRVLEEEQRSGASLHGRSVRSLLSRLDLCGVEAGDECRDLDTPEDLRWWRGRLGRADQR